MKFAKKFFVVLVAMALLVTCLAISSSATSDFTADNIEDVIEYHLYETYMIETFENYEVTEYDEDDGVIAGYEYADDDRVEIKNAFSFSESGKASLDYAVELDGENNKVLKVTNTTNNEIDYTAKFDKATDKLVVSVRVKTNDFVTEDNNPVNGSKFSIVLQVNNPANEIDKTPTLTMFAMDCRDTENMKFTFCEYTKSGDDHIYSDNAVVSNIAPELDKWYQIDAVFDFAEGKYSVDIESEDGVTGGVNGKSLGTLESAKSVRLLMNDVVGKTGTVTYLDNVFVYQGSFVRDVENKDAATSAAIISLDAMANDAATSLEDRVRIADVYGRLFDENDLNYKTTAPVPPNEDEEIPGVPGTPNKDRIDEIIAKSEAYMNSTYAEALITYVDSLKTLTYYDKIKMAGQHYDDYDIDGYADRFDAMFCENGQTEADVAELPGLTAEVAADITRVKELYDAEQDVIKTIEYQSNAFGSLLMGFDPNNKDYNYIKESFEALSLFTKRDGTFKFAVENEIAEENIKFATIADAEPIYTALGAKKAEIEANAINFMRTVDKMSAEPVPQQGFAELYATYTEAVAAYNGGVIHRGLDNSTYPGLSAVITIYNIRCDYVEQRVALSEEFKSIVKVAAASTYYPTIVAQLAKAAPYVDPNNKAIEFDYEGVTEAKATYDALQADVATIKADSDAYLAAVNAIDMTAAYSALKAAVKDAVAKDKGANFLGIPGITEANIKLAEAEAKVKSLEGNSETLIAAVEQLKAAKTLAERRELIFVANAAQAKAEATITGVAAAKTELASQIAKYDADIAAANAALVAATEGACDVASFAAPTAGMYKSADVVKAMLK